MASKAVEEFEQARSNSSHAIDADSTRHLFARASTLPLEALSATGYACIEYFFRWINWKEQRFTQQNASNVAVLALPLFGIETLWEIALRAQDEQVRALAAHPAALPALPLVATGRADDRANS